MSDACEEGDADRAAIVFAASAPSVALAIGWAACALVLAVAAAVWALLA